MQITFERGDDVIKIAQSFAFALTHYPVDLGKIQQIMVITEGVRKTTVILLIDDQNGTVAS